MIIFTDSRDPIFKSWDLAGPLKHLKNLPLFQVDIDRP